MTAAVSIYICSGSELKRCKVENLQRKLLYVTLSLVRNGFVPLLWRYTLHYLHLSEKKKKSVHIEVLFVRVGYYWSFLLIKGKRRNVFEQQHVMECSHWEQLVSTDSTAQFGTRHAKKTKCRCVGVSSIPASKPKSCTGVLFGNFQTPFVNVNAFKSRSHWLFFKSTKPETCLKGPIHFCYKTFSSV